MKYLRFIFFVILSFFSITQKCIAQEINIGVGPTFAFSPAVFGLQGRLSYGLNEKFAIAGTYSYYFKKNVNYSVETDIKYKLLNIQEYCVMPLVGVNLNRLYTDNTRVSLNAGLFIQIEREWVDLYFEPKFVLDDTSYFSLSSGLWF